ncbi:MAG: hypothetical protein M1837_002762 [Sclerophora amabilis]|nr:MAG: hypothetical protein M1837_002762 [Sclerophora amabilis]
MDPRMVQARNQYRQKKERQINSKMTPFQRKLSRNPFAQALDTPVRLCCLTSTHLPSFFLQSFELVSRDVGRRTQSGASDHRSNASTLPAPSKSFQSPLYVLPKGLSYLDKSSSKEPGHYEPGNPAVHSSKSRVTPESEPLEGSSESPFEPNTQTQTAAYTLLDFSLLNAAPTVKKPPLWSRLLSFRVRSKVSDPQRVIWRDDMAPFILQRLRNRVVHEMLYLTQRQRGYLQPYIPSSYPKQKSIGAILYLGPKSRKIQDVPHHKSSPKVENISTSNEERSSEVDSGPTDPTEAAQFSSLPSADETPAGIPGAIPGQRRLAPPSSPLFFLRDEQQCVPMFNLPHLLGTETFGDLMRELPIEYSEQTEVAIIKSRRRSAELGMWLWKLQGAVDSRETPRRTIEM